jgi:hypothetical protein
MTPEQTQEISRLRALDLSPKQIARQLGLRPTEVTAFIKAQATEIEVSRTLRGELAPLEGCLIDAGTARKLLKLQKGNELVNYLDSDAEDGDGLTQIVVTRVEKKRYIACLYLVDCLCLGVKDAMGPRKLDYFGYQNLVNHIYGSTDRQYCEISLEQAQAIVFGAVDYARKLGFEPHADFEAAKVNLGAKLENLPEIEFGIDGKPFYISGPYDNPNAVIAKLNASVGEGNYDCLMDMTPDFWDY